MFCTCYIGWCHRFFFSSPTSQQFVPFRDYMDRTGNHVLSMARLAKDVLAEIPDQLISYMKSRGIKPNPVPPIYSTGTQPQTNPVWAPRSVWNRVRMYGNPLKALSSILTQLKDDETPFWFWSSRTAVGGPADQGVSFSLSVKMWTQSYKRDV